MMMVDGWMDGWYCVYGDDEWTDELNLCVVALVLNTTMRRSVTRLVRTRRSRPSDGLSPQQGAPLRTGLVRQR
jgi:hypothetical protein